MKRDDLVPIFAMVCFVVFLAANWNTIWGIKSSNSPQPQPQTLLNLDEMARKWNATPTYFLATTNRVTVQDTTIYGVTTLRIDPPTQAMEDFPPSQSLWRTGPPPPSLQRTGPK